MEISEIRSDGMSRLDNIEMRQICIPEFDDISNKSPTIILREFSGLLKREEFRQLVYASLTGIQVLVRGPELERLEALFALSSLVPRACRRVKIRAREYTDSEATINFLGLYVVTILGVNR